VGVLKSASTFGGALFVKYSFNDHFHLATRAEYISSSGSLSNGAPSLIYGPGSKAWSLTVTPTYQKGIFFVRAEASYVRAVDSTPGFALGPNLDKKSQSRALLETGFMF
jgi:hypothetical protein